MQAWKQRFLADGVDHVDQVVEATTFRERHRLLNPCVDEGGWFLGDQILEALTDELHFPQRNLSANDIKQNFPAIFDDRDLGPVLAWVWACLKNAPFSLPYYHEARESMREQGYVMLNESRLYQLQSRRFEPTPIHTISLPSVRTTGSMIAS